ncbi:MULTISPECIES: YxeA family protein [unclassified Enterococcus]|jgi:uncharacterized protein (TIGR01655 family)|uniref:YxeA family protein n=1 Tax=unclassified Enterococcus TaxID=2608891 RepID=UPI0003541324|nr:hypothetical protein D920_02496 [Enterococcus faecalis 13-SD-W-01]
MKFLKGLLAIVVVGGIALFGLKMYTESQSGELAATIDQVNPLVPKGERYVKTKKPDEVNDYGTATYIQQAADENGNAREIRFNGISVLKEERYLKLYTKGGHVETYEEVDKSEVPEKALAIIG